MNTNTSNIIDLILSTRFIFPTLDTKSKGNSHTIARQLDVALMENGFKMSHDLFNYVAGLSFKDSIFASQTMLNSVEKIVGSHVKHKTYFIQFPKNIPDTYEFWWSVLTKYFFEGKIVYGQHLHTYEDMLEYHSKLKIPSGSKFKFINLGDSLNDEVTNLFTSIVNSTVPLNEKTRKDIEILVSFDSSIIPFADPTIRENKAIINSLKMFHDLPIEVDTVVDVLRLAAELSKGDVTLTTNTKFRKFSSSEKRVLVGAINSVAKTNDKIEDGLRFREQFKRLARQINPRKIGGKYAVNFFDVIGGNKKFKTSSGASHEHFINGLHTKDYTDFIKSLKNKVGKLVRSIDSILRNGNTDSLNLLVETIDGRLDGVSGRNLLSLYQHIQNRLDGVSDTRIFVNKLGRGYVISDERKDLKTSYSKTILKIIEKEIYDRVPVIENLKIDPIVNGVAVPLSEKSKSDGLGVLPRGSIINIGKMQGNDSLRFFIYWKENGCRTDYDLSGAFYGENMEYIDQISWTHLRSGDGTIVHSGDFTSAPNGASEFIDIKLDKIDPRIKYIVPTVNKFAGNSFKECEECFFGFMERTANGRGLPFEPTTVKTKFNVKGDGGVAYPLVFVRENGVWYAKWLDLYAAARSYCNRVEANKYATMTVAKSIVDNKYLDMETLLGFYLSKSVKNERKGETLVTVGNVEKTDKIEKIIGINDLKSLIPA